jgi:hypothetical protein
MDETRVSSTCIVRDWNRKRFKMVRGESVKIRRLSGRACIKGGVPALPASLTEAGEGGVVQVGLDATDLYLKFVVAW